MNYIKEKSPIIFGVLLFITLCVIAYYYLFIGVTIYYTQVDNTKIEAIQSDDNMKYQYTLVSYKENGKKKTLKFKTSRELREDAYLKIEYMAVSGVHAWAEVQYDELPMKVKDKYSD